MGMIFFFNPQARVHVYNKMDAEDLLKMRCTSHQINQEIEDHMSFNVKLDQSYKCFRQLLRLRISSCAVANFTMKSVPPKRLFSFPEKVRKLVCDGVISKRILDIIISRCTHLTTLILTHETLRIHGLISSKSVQNKLTFLKTLSLQVLRNPGDDQSELNSNVSVLLSSRFPSLATLKCYVSLCGNWVPLLKFIERHAQSVKELVLETGDLSDRENTIKYLHSNPHNQIWSFLNRKKLQSLDLKRFELHDDLLNLNFTVLDVWQQILAAQQTLIYFRLHSPGELSESLLRVILNNNQVNLKEISVSNIKHVIERPIFNLHMFSRCTKLEVLSITNTMMNSREVNDRNIHLCNMDVLPVSLTELIISGYCFDINEISTFTYNAASLKHIVITDAGPMSYSQLLCNIMKNSPFLEYINVRPIVSPNGESAVIPTPETIEGNQDRTLLSKLYSKFMNAPYDPLDDLNGFEAFLLPQDRQWISDNV